MDDPCHPVHGALRNNTQRGKSHQFKNLIEEIIREVIASQLWRIKIIVDLTTNRLV
jgi:hypothetical protein